MTINFGDIRAQIKQRGSIYHLDNGATLMVENVPNSGLVTGRIGILGGSVYEKPGDEGTVHYLEHMSFNGSRLYTNSAERDLRAATIGLDLNANTGVFQVAYPVRGRNSSGYLLQKNFPEAFRIMSDMVYFPSLTQRSMERERAIIQRERVEISQENPNPMAQALQAVGRRVYNINQALMKPPIGTEETINAVTLDKLRQYHQQLFVASNTSVSIIGDLKNGTDIVGQVKDMLQDIPKGQKVQPIESLPELIYNGRERFEVQAPTNGSSVVNIYFQTVPFGDREVCAVELLAYILGGGNNSLLFQDLREQRGLVYGIGANTEGHSKTGFLKVSYQVNPQRLEESLAAVEDNITRLKNGQFNHFLVDAFKAAHLPNALATLQTPGWILTELDNLHDKKQGIGETTGVERLEMKLNLTAQDAIDAANKFLGNNRLETIISPSY